MHFVLVGSLLLSGVFAIESNFYLEPKCGEVNGFCVLESECPNTVSSTHSNLCPNQKTNGAVCCTSISWKDVSCRQSRNACQEQCRDSLNLGQKECPTGQTCCVLTK